MRAVAAAVAILAILASPHGLGAFLPGDAGPVLAPSPAEPAPPPPHLFSPPQPSPGPRGPLAPPVSMGVLYKGPRDAPDPISPYPLLAAERPYARRLQD